MKHVIQLISIYHGMFFKTHESFVKKMCSEPGFSLGIQSGRQEEATTVSWVNISRPIERWNVAWDSRTFNVTLNPC